MSIFIELQDIACYHCVLIMILLSLPALAIALLAVVVTSIIARRRQSAKALQTPPLPHSAEPNALVKALASALPDDVILPRDVATFQRYTSSYWAQQECEVVPACIVRPRNAGQLCVAVDIIRQEYQRQKEQGVRGRALSLFAIRSGGHSAVHGAASIGGGTLLDLGLLNNVRCAEDGLSVTVGTGARWGDVSQVLDERGLAVTGGRNSDVGVGGLALGGMSLLPFSHESSLCQN